MYIYATYIYYIYIYICIILYIYIYNIIYIYILTVGCMHNRNVVLGYLIYASTTSLV